MNGEPAEVWALPHKTLLEVLREDMVHASFGRNDRRLNTFLFSVSLLCVIFGFEGDCRLVCVTGVVRSGPRREVVVREGSLR